MRNSLDLAGDGDELDLIASVERTFGMDITNAEAEALRNVGQLYDLIQAKCGANGTEACFSQIAFYALRRALAPLVKTNVTRNTPISVVRELGAGSIARDWKDLGRRSGLQLPWLETPFSMPRPSVWLARIFKLLIAITIASGFYVADHYFGVKPDQFAWTAFGLALSGLLIVIAVQFGLHLAYRDIPSRIATVGDLAREAAGCSFSTLRQSKPTPSAADRWYALTAILRQLSGYKMPISRATTFFSR